MIDEKKLVEELKENNIDILMTDGECFGLGKCTENVVELINKQPQVGEWIPADEPPKDDNYILLSFKNYSCPLVGRYEPDGEMGGAYYLGDCDGEDTCTANNLFINAWQPLPEPYRKGE